MVKVSEFYRKFNMKLSRVAFLWRSVTFPYQEKIK